MDVKNIIEDNCRHYLWKSKPVNHIKKTDFIVFTYINRYLEDVNLNRICNSTDVTSLYPIPNNPDFSVSYKYSQTIRSKVLNYGATLLKDNIYPTTCDCHNSTFKDPDLGHIATGDLSIIPNRALRNLLCKGVNFRECHKHKTTDVLSAVGKDLDNHIKKLGDRKNLPLSDFALWKSEIIRKVSQQLSSLKIVKFPKPRLSKPSVKNSLADLHRKYVFVPTDKAQNNISVVCKKYYLDVLREELESHTYVKIDNISEEQIVSKHVDDLSNLKIVVEENQQKLPFIYWTTKRLNSTKLLHLVASSYLERPAPQKHCLRSSHLSLNS